VDSSNNYFTLIQYLATPTNLDANTVPTLTNIDPYLSPGSPQFGDPNTTIIQTFDISFSSFIKLDMSYSRSTLLTDLNNQLKNTAIYPFIDVSNSGIFLTGIQDLSCSYNIRDVSYVELDLKLSRYTTQNIYNYKTCIQFPAENTPPNNSRYIWRDIIGNGTSCFNFDASRTYFELNNINGEDTPLITNYVIDQNPYILLRCIRQQYDFSFNDFVIKVENSANIDTEGYLLTEYIQEINRGIFNANKTSISPDNNDLNLPTTDLSYNIIPNFLLPPNNGITWNTYCFQDPNNFIVNFQFDITRKFTENRYMIDPSNTILLDILGIDITSETDISGNNPFTCIFPIRANGYNVPFNIPIIKFILKDQYNGSPINYIRYDVYMDASGDQSTTVKTYLTAADMVTDINLALSNFLFYYSRLGVQFSDNPIQGTQLSFLQSLGQQFKTTLDVNINVTLTTEDYQAVFYDGSGGYYDNSGYYFNESPWSSAGSWSQNLFFTDQSYNLINYITTGNYADISGSKLVLANEIILTDSNNHIYFEPISTANGLVQGNNTITLTLSAGIVYSRIGLLDEINTQIHANPLLTGSYFYVDNNGRCRIRVNINQIFTSNNYQLVFYDSINFVKCYVGATSVRNVSWDSTLGWILGFRQQTTYDLSGYYTSNVPSGTASITGDSTVALNLYNYFMIILDDFNQNHLNDGLVTITKKDYGIYNSSYSARSPNVCNNPAISSNQLSITDTAIIQNFDGNNTKTNLTQNQIYSNLQLLNANKTNNTLVQTSPGPYIKDIFGIIPLKTAGLSPGQPYIEFGGTLQAQERVYFGPVNIHRMRIQLITDHGDIINLNGQNWSFSLLCEQLYQNRAV
jgi:hypothetical protein